MKVIPREDCLVVKYVDMPQYGRLAGTKMFSSDYRCGVVEEVSFSLNDLYNEGDIVVFLEGLGVPFRKRRDDGLIEQYFVVGKDAILCELQPELDK